MIVEKAKAFAEAAHAGQFRKHGNRPYIYHPAKVAELLEKYSYYDKVIAAAWLHDVLEDTDVSYNDLKEEFGRHVANLVLEVTQPDVVGNRKQRWQVYLQHYEKATLTGMSLKLADRICNLTEYKDFWPDVPKQDREFLRTIYLEESNDLLEAIGGTDYRLACKLSMIINELDELCSKECEAL